MDNIAECANSTGFRSTTGHNDRAEIAPDGARAHRSRPYGVRSAEQCPTLIHATMRRPAGGRRSCQRTSKSSSPTPGREQNLRGGLRGTGFRSVRMLSSCRIPQLSHRTFTIDRSHVVTSPRFTMTWYPCRITQITDDVELPLSIVQCAACRADTHSARSWEHGIGG